MRNVKEYSGMEIVIPRFLFILLAIIQLVINFYQAFEITLYHICLIDTAERGDMLRQKSLGAPYSE